MTKALTNALRSTRIPKNFLLNGGMQVSQENGSVAGTANGYFPADQWSVGISGISGTLTVAQVASPTPGGSPNRLRVTVTAADASVAATDDVFLQQKLEGSRIAELRFGSSAAKALVLQFGVKAPAGTYGVSIWNGAAARANVQEFTISPAEANTDVVKTVSFAGDTLGTWATDSTLGMYLFFCLMGGSNYQGTVGWQAISATSPITTANQFNLMGTNGNVFELFDVGLYEGTVAPPFTLPEYFDELAECMRYWELLTVPLVGGYASISGQVQWGSVPYKVDKRIVPAFTNKVAPTLVNCSYAVGAIHAGFVRLDVTSSAVGYSYIQSGSWAVNARL